MKYSKELHKILDGFVKLNEENNPEARLATVEETHAMLDEIERLQAENERLSGWVDNVCKTAKCWSIYPPPPDAS